MSLLLTTLISSLLPVGVEGIKQFIVTKMGGVKATTVAEQIQLEEQDVRRLEAIATLDNPGGVPSQWVINLRGSSRYIAAVLIIGSGIALLFLPETSMEVRAMGFEAANIAFGFLFGQRITANFVKR